MVLANGGVEVLSLKRPTSERRKHPWFSTLVGWSGWASALAGVLFAVWGYVDREEKFWYLDIPVIVLGVVVPLLVFVGLTGVYTRWRGQAGWLGGTGFALSLVGAGQGIYAGVINSYTIYVQIASTGDYWQEGRTLPEGNNEAAAVAQQGWLLMTLWSSWLGLLLAGLTIAGLAAVRTRGLRGWGLLLLIMALFGWVYQFTGVGTPVEAHSIHIVFGVLFSLSWVVLGYALWSSRNTLRRQQEV